MSLNAMNNRCRTSYLVSEDTELLKLLCEERNSNATTKSENPPSPTISMYLLLTTREDGRTIDISAQSRP